MLRLEQALVQLQELALGLQLVREPALQLVRESPRVREPEPVWKLELTAVPEQVWELRVSRQLELQQHRLPTAAQERLPYLPALPMKAPCWGAPAW